MLIIPQKSKLNILRLLIIVAPMLYVQSGFSADDIPDFNGVWIGVRPAPAQSGGRGGDGSRGRGARMRPQVTAEAQEIMDNYDLLTDDPAYECSPASISRAFANPTPSEIEQHDDRVILRHEYMDVERIIYIDGREHDPNAVPDILGYSIGRYEGSTLVIDTRRFASSVISTISGLPQTEALHTVERLTLSDNGERFRYQTTFEDPSTLTVPWVTTRNYRRAPELNILEFDCVLEDANYIDHVNNE